MSAVLRHAHVRIHLNSNLQRCSGALRHYANEHRRQPTRCIFNTAPVRAVVKSDLWRKLKQMAAENSRNEKGARIGASTADIESVIPTAGYPQNWPFSAEDFSRVDESSDGDFYVMPRFVQHIDVGALYALSLYYGDVFMRYVDHTRHDKASVDVLDLCSSWISHFPTDVPYGNVVGVGMNEMELERNGQLTSYVVQDMNNNPCLSTIEDDSFDVVTCCASIDYLTSPRLVVAEALRVLRPGGTLMISFSNRMFPTKAIKAWVEGTDADRVWMAGAFVHYSCLADAPGDDATASDHLRQAHQHPVIGQWRWSEVQALDLSPSNHTDPLYVVTAVKAGVTP